MIRFIRLHQVDDLPDTDVNQPTKFFTRLGLCVRAGKFSGQKQAGNDPVRSWKWYNASIFSHMLSFKKESEGQRVRSYFSQLVDLNYSLTFNSIGLFHYLPVVGK